MTIIDFDATIQTLILNEAPNSDALAYLEKNFMALEIAITSAKCRDEKMDFASSFREFKKYIKNVRENNGRTEYSHKNKNAPGRMSASALSIQRLPKKITHTLYQGKCDCDEVASHPTIAVTLLERFGMKNDHIQNYISNRESWLSRTMDELKMTRGEAKQFYNSILFGAAKKKLDASDEFLNFYEGYYREAHALMDRVCDKYPNLKKESEKKVAIKDYHSVEGGALSYFISNFENQIGLLAIKFIQNKNITVYGYAYDGFLMDRVENLSEVLSELDAYILEETGFPMKFVDKQMESAIDMKPMDEIIEEEKKEIVEIEVEEEKVPSIPWEDDMEYNHDRIRDYCLTWEEQLLGNKNKHKFMKKIIEYCDKFFATIEDENNGIVRERFHMVNGVRRRLEFVRCKNWTAYTSDKNCFSMKRDESNKPICLFSLSGLGTYSYRRKYPRFNFYPSTEVQADFFNTFNGFHYERTDEVVDDTIAPILTHIKEIWCNGNEDTYHYTIRYLASMIQRPETQLKVALVVKGEEGVGKGCIITDVIGKIMGVQNKITSSMGAFRVVKNQNDVFGQFTTMLEGACALFLDEMVWGGDKKSAGILKALITEETLKIEAKGYSPYMSRAFQNVIMSSNEDWVVPASAEARRFFVIEPNNKWAGVQSAESKAYFDAILSVPTQMIANYFYRFDLKDWNPRSFPQTEALFDQKIASMDPASIWFMNRIEMGEDEWYLESSKTTIFTEFLEWSKTTHQYSSGVCDRVFWKRLRQFGVSDKKVRVDGGFDRVALFPSYSEAKASFIKMYRIPESYSWGEL